MLADTDAWRMLRLLNDHHPGDSTEIALITTWGADGEPIRDWSAGFHTHVDASRGHWPVILAVEQFLHRVVSIPLVGRHD
jgi:hypothetical protein